MSSVIIDQEFPYDIVHRGQKDAIRHNKRVNDAVRKQLKDIISQQDIITSEGNKKVKVRLKYLDQYRFRRSPDRIDELGRDEYDDLENGEIISKPNSDGSGNPLTAGRVAGEELYETEFTIDELTDMMIEELELPDFDETKKNEITSQILEYTDRRKRMGNEACLDKKHTLLAHIKRRAQLNVPKSDILTITQDDMRYKTWEISQEKHSNAIIFLLMDRSGSMWEDKIYSVKALYFWVIQFLRRHYEKVEIKFIAHDYFAKELNEKEFFTISDSGGTRVSSAYELCRNMIKHNYPSNTWNIYCFHSSDGDSWSDEEYCVDLVKEILELGANLFAYAEINFDNYRDTPSKLYLLLKQTAKTASRLMISTIEERGEIITTLERFLKRSHASVERVV